jgi:hypothetical protein
MRIETLNGQRRNPVENGPKATAGAQSSGQLRVKSTEAADGDAHVGGVQQKRREGTGRDLVRSDHRATVEKA